MDPLSVHLSMCPSVHLFTCTLCIQQSSWTLSAFQTLDSLSSCSWLSFSLSLPVHVHLWPVSAPRLSVEGSQPSSPHGSPAWVAFPWFTRLLLGRHLFPPLSPLMSLSPERLLQCTCSLHFAVPTDSPDLCSTPTPSCGWPSGSCVRSSPLWWSDAATTGGRASEPPQPSSLVHPSHPPPAAPALCFSSSVSSSHFELHAGAPSAEGTPSASALHPGRPESPWTLFTNRVGFTQETEVLLKHVHHTVLSISLKIRATKGTFHAKMGTINDKAVWT